MHALDIDHIEAALLNVATLRSLLLVRPSVCHSSLCLCSCLYVSAYLASFANSINSKIPIVKKHPLILTNARFLRIRLNMISFIYTQLEACNFSINLSAQ